RPVGSWGAYPTRVYPCPAFDIGDEIDLVHPSSYVRYGGHLLCVYNNVDIVSTEDLIRQSEYISRQFKYEC
ncbi:hypothetical protein, partial [Vibrio campbellii]|uniref:hypothetical protein n=1 Tax=Vibrio campbellii TaxID=680 RepID=UPI001BD9FFC2